MAPLASRSSRAAVEIVRPIKKINLALFLLDVVVVTVAAMAIAWLAQLRIVDPFCERVKAKNSLWLALGLGYDCVLRMEAGGIICLRFPSASVLSLIERLWSLSRCADICCFSIFHLLCSAYLIPSVRAGTFLSKTFLYDQ